jgi:hypothetical protein
MNESERLSDRDRIAADPVGAWILAAENDEEFVRLVCEGFEWQLDELETRIAGVMEIGRLEAGRRQALLERIAATVALLVELADAVETDLGRCAR